MAKYFKFIGIIAVIAFLGFGVFSSFSVKAYIDPATGTEMNEDGTIYYPPGVSDGASDSTGSTTSTNGGGGLVPCGPVSLGFSHACTVCDFFVMIDKIIDFISIDIVPPLALLLIIIGGVMMIVSGGSEDNYKKGKTIITSAIVGLLIIWGSWLIIDTIMSGLTSLGNQGGSTAPNFVPWNTIQCQ